MGTHAHRKPREAPQPGSPADAKFPIERVYAAAVMYYIEDATQAEVAERLHTSRATVSRLLSEARRLGIVRIEVRPPATDEDELGQRLADALSLRAVYVGAEPPDAMVGATLAPQVAEALIDADLVAGDTLLVSSGRAVWSTVQHRVPRLPGVIVTPTVGGQNEPAAWYQTNEITRLLAQKMGGRPVFLHAPAMPGPELFGQLIKDQATRAVLELWASARCALLGVGAPPSARESMPAFVDRGAPWLRDAAGDICSRFYDHTGTPIDFPGSDRLIAIRLETLRRIPVTIAIAAGTEKVPSIRAGARAGWFNSLVTDTATARALLTEADPEPGGASSQGIS